MTAVYTDSLIPHVQTVATPLRQTILRHVLTSVRRVTWVPNMTRLVRVAEQLAFQTYEDQRMAYQSAMARFVQRVLAVVTRPTAAPPEGLLHAMVLSEDYQWLVPFTASAMRAHSRRELTTKFDDCVKEGVAEIQSRTAKYLDAKPCRKCWRVAGSICLKSKMTKCGDEGQTNYWMCELCGHRWTEE